MKEEEEARLLPSPGEFIEVRADVGGITHTWILSATAAAFIEEGNGLRIEGMIQASGASRGLDIRIEQQREAIDRLLKMLEAHHGIGDHLYGCETCKTGRFAPKEAPDGE